MTEQYKGPDFTFFFLMVFSVSLVYNFFLITNVSTNQWLALSQSSRFLKGTIVKGNACHQGKMAINVWMTLPIPGVSSLEVKAGLGQETGQGYIYAGERMDL